MRVTMVYSASRAREVHVMRTLDGRRRRLVLATGFGLRPAEIVELAAPQLTSDELAALREALGVDQPGGAA
jgi:hypothetical protein